MIFRCSLIALTALALLAGCAQRSKSGAYVFHDDTSAALMVITVTPDHRFTGTLRRASLREDGTISTVASPVSGTLDGSSMTLVVGAETVSATVDDGIDVIGPADQGPGTRISHFARGAVEDYNTYAHQLEQAATALAANGRKTQQMAAARADATALIKDLNDFVTQSRGIIDKTPAVIAMYSFEVQNERQSLQTGRALKASGSPAGAAQAGDLRTKMLGADRDFVTAMDSALSSGRTNSSRREALLDQRLLQFKACGKGVDGAINAVALNRDSNAGTSSLDAQTCKALSDAQSAYRNVQAPLEKALSDATSVKIKADAELARIWDAAKKALD